MGWIDAPTPTDDSALSIATLSGSALPARVSGAKKVKNLPAIKSGKTSKSFATSKLDKGKRIMSAKRVRGRTQSLDLIYDIN
jgi:hypothetical protein